MKINGRISNDEIRELIKHHGLTVKRVEQLTVKKPEKSKGKTILQWFESYLDKRIRKRLLNNLYEVNKNSQCKSMEMALVGGFRWKDSPEGDCFWINIYNKL